MATEAEQQLQAYVEYFRDLGVRDFYRRGAPIIAAEIAEPAREAMQAPQPVPTVSARTASHADVPVPIPSSVHDLPESTIAKLISFNDLAPLPVERVSAQEKAAALLAVQQEIGDCTRCPLAYLGRHKIVFGDGNPNARLMFVGEGPGADEDTQGLPFVGKAGQLLNNMIAAMGLKREEVYIANIVKCRPPNNRVPEPAEANVCTQFLVRQMDIVRPEIVVALGATAALYLLGVKRSLSALRGHWHTCRGAKLAVTYHPAFLLRDPRQKAEAWKDLQMVMAEMGLKPAAKP